MFLAAATALGDAQFCGMPRWGSRGAQFVRSVAVKQLSFSLYFYTTERGREHGRRERR